ncbi:unnamed protein product [Polarella glacialis]|uniref:Aspartyl/asparaginy/proline hydroxylase domain-containing protein n=1 Tax=Polarella glacialis TaxID=89957 RepID=A0A813HAX3_POLGL|nr:unnamed protein product [Polarella glacialis]
MGVFSCNAGAGSSGGGLQLKLCLALVAAWDSMQFHPDPTDIRTVRLLKESIQAFECRAEALGFESGSQAVVRGTLELANNMPLAGEVMIRSMWRPVCGPHGAAHLPDTPFLLSSLQDPSDSGEFELGLPALARDIFRFMLVFPLWEQRLHLTQGHWLAPLVKHVDPMGRITTAGVLAWWQIQSVLLNPDCAYQALAVGSMHCPRDNFGLALRYGQYVFDPGLVQDIFADIQAAVASYGPVGALAESFEALRSLWGFGPYRFHFEHPLFPPLPSTSVWNSEQIEKYPDLVSLRDMLERHSEELLDGWKLFRGHPDAEAQAKLGYPLLIHNGTWRQWQFYTSRDGWNEKLCSGFPSLCRIIGTSLARRSSGLPIFGESQEEVTINELSPGAQILPHTGAPYRLQMHMGLSGLAGSYLGVFDGTVDADGEPQVVLQPWEAGRVKPVFDDSYLHYARAWPGSLEPRAVLDVGLLHPEIIKSKHEA